MPRAGNVIDSLALEIVANSQSALTALETLVHDLENVKGAIQDFGTVKINNIVSKAAADNLKSFSEAVNTIDVGKLKEFSLATKGIEAINIGLNEKAGESLELFGIALNEIDTGKMFEFGAATSTIRPFDFGIGEKSAESLELFARSLETLNLDKLREFGVVNSMFEGLKRIGIGARTGENVASFADALDRLNVGKLREMASIDFSNMRVMADASKSIASLASQLERLEKTTERAENAQRRLDKSLGQTRKTAGSSARSFNLANTALGRFFNSIKRIAFYRAIRSAIKAVTQGFSEGIENLYYWSQMVGTSFAPRMDQLATATQYLKNGFASMFSPLIEYAIPIIDRLIDRLVDMFNVAQELFARLTGAATWNKALKYPVSYKEELDDAGKSAKALQNILMDFDEINAINTPKSGSRGSGGDEKDYLSMFQLMETGSSGSPFGKLGTIFEDIAGKVEYAWGTAKKFWDFFKGLDFQPMIDSASSLWNDTLSPILDELNQDAAWLEEKVLEPVTQFLVEKGIPAATDTLSVAIDNLWKSFQPFKDGVKKFWDDNGEWIMEFTKQTFLQALDKIQEAFKKIGKFFDKNKTTIDSIFKSLSSLAKKTSPFLTAISKMLGTHAWDTFVDSIESILYAVEPILTTLAGILELIDEGGLGITRIGQSIVQAILNPVKLVINGFATVIEAISYIVGLFDKDAAEAMRTFAGQCRGVVTEMDNIDVKFGNWIEDLEKTSTQTGLAIDANSRLGRSYAQMAQDARKSYTDITSGMSTSASQAYTAWWNSIYNINGTFKQIPNTARPIFDSLAVMAQEASRNIYNKFGYNLNQYITLGDTIGSNLRNGIVNGIRQVNLNIPATITLTNTTSKAKIHGATFDMSLLGFASGGFPVPGSLFYAGENNIPELMGTVGGRTAVAGGAEITGIREAIVEQGQREEGLLRQLISAVANKDLTLVANSATGRWVNKALKSYQGVTG